MHNYTGFGAPVMLFLHCSRVMGPPQWADMGMWLQSVMLLLVEQGLASCPQECWAMYGATVRATLGLGDDHILLSGLAIGYADEEAAGNQWQVPRDNIEEEIEWRGDARVNRKKEFSRTIACLAKATGAGKPIPTPPEE